MKQLSRTLTYPRYISFTGPVLTIVALLIFHLPLAKAATPTLPQVQVDTTYTEPTGRVIVVPAGGDFQAALNEAQPGDVIELVAGAVYSGPFLLPVKQGDEWITIRSDQYSSALPEAGTRVTPADSSAMATLMAWPGAVISTMPGAHHYRFIGIKVRGGEPREGVSSGQSTLIDLSAHAPLTANLPHHIVFDRCYLKGAPLAGTRRGIAMNAAHVAVIDSHLSGFVSRREDSQAIAGWDGPGPYSIINNYLEAAGINVMFGGADPSTVDRVPSDIEIRGNHLAKLPAWRPGNVDHTDSDWSIKNLFELKNARRVLIEGNLFEHNWTGAQVGFAILFTVRNQDGRSPWSVVEDVTFRSNIIRHVGAGINVLGWDDIHSSKQTSRILIDNNLFHDVGGDRGHGRLFQLLDGTADVHIRNNTAIQKGSFLVVEGAVHTGFVFNNNIVMLDEPGISGTDTAPGNPTLDRYFDNPEFHTNVMLGERRHSYPAGTRFHRSPTTFGFVDADSADFRLNTNTGGRRGRQTNVPGGVNFELLCAALSTSERPAYC